MIETIIPTKSKISIPKKRYAEINRYIEIAEAFSRNMFRPIFIADLYKKNILYVSTSFSDLMSEEVPGQSLFSGQQYIPSFANEDIPTLKDILEKAYDLFISSPIEERKKMVFSFSFNSSFNGKKRVVHQSMTPLAMTEDGDLWLVLCTTFFSSRKTPGDYVMRVHNDDEYLQYNSEKGRWYLKEGIGLSSEEKEILLLSSQGYTMKEIASILNKSLDSIKLYKRMMFSKLNVRSITEAIFAAINKNLI